MACRRQGECRDDSYEDDSVVKAEYNERKSLKPLNMNMQSHIYNKGAGFKIQCLSFTLHCKTNFSFSVNVDKNKSNTDCYWKVF